MLERQLCPSRVLTPFREEFGNEELSVLPKHTKVIVTGNNRTKSVLVGLQGVVKKAVGLGGWHWLVLKNGVEVKLQRNALSVLEPPSGNEDNDDYDFDFISSGSDISEKGHQRLSSGFHYTKISKPRVRYSRPFSPFASARFMNHSSCQNTQSKNQATQLGVNLAKLGTGSLWRYCQSFNLEKISANPTKEQLVDAVQHHFLSQAHVEEVQVILDFIRSAKRLQSVGAS